MRRPVEFATFPPALQLEAGWGPYRAVVRQVIDGDTLDVRARDAFAADITSLRRAYDEQALALSQAERTAAALAELLVKAGRALEPPSNGDWACAECKPYSDMIRPGFQCAYHAVQAWMREQAALAPTKEACECWHDSQGVLMRCAAHYDALPSTKEEA